MFVAYTYTGNIKINIKIENKNTWTNVRDHLLYLSGLIVLLRKIFNQAVKSVAKKTVIEYIYGYTHKNFWAFCKKKNIEIITIIEPTNPAIILHAAVNQTATMSIFGGPKTSSDVILFFSSIFIKINN